MNEIEFNIFEDPTRRKKIAQWKRAFGYDRETKQIFLPIQNNFIPLIADGAFRRTDPCCRDDGLFKI